MSATIDTDRKKRPTKKQSMLVMLVEWCVLEDQQVPPKRKCSRILNQLRNGPIGLFRCFVQQ